ncbi:response regulator transcription factor [Kangiella sp. TOML190]|uniref:response regulator transcription factor n=1 Tax=Kangiella sp. TOML190 TaxID=2931351 RepID=UPI00203CC98E|nr:response regulator transcription factor [Kangiella sp. TOML190]
MSEIIKVLYLEDDIAQSEALKQVLKETGYDFTHCLTGTDLLKQIEENDFDLMILDWEVPDLTGVEVLEQVRSFHNWKGPILFVTQRDAEQDIVQALEKGADDYMVKPFRPTELEARLKALVRRAGLLDNDADIELGIFTISQKHREVLVDGKPVSLTTKEYELALLLMKNLGRLYSRRYLLKNIWGIDSDISTRTVDAHVSSLRRKLGLRASSGYQIKTVYQHGYRLEKLLESEAVA